MAERIEVIVHLNGQPRGDSTDSFADQVIVAAFKAAGEDFFAASAEMIDKGGEQFTSPGLSVTVYP